MANISVSDFNERLLEHLNSINFPKDLSERGRVSSKVSKSTETFSVYVGNPFCFKACKFCMYRPIESKIGSSMYNEFYNNTLPNMISAASIVLKEHIPDSIYFGGGTVNMMSVDIFKRICNSIPNFKHIPSKCTELHPMLVTDKFLDAVIELGFTYVSIGVQSLNEGVLEVQQRFFASKERLSWIVSKLQGAGISVNCDLIAYLQSPKVMDLENLKRDIEFLTDELDVTSLTVYPLIQRFKKDQSYGAVSNNLKMIRSLREAILGTNILDKYNPFDSISMSMKDRDIIDYGCFDYKFIKNGNMKKMCADYNYNCSGPTTRLTNLNLLAMGGKGKHFIYSYIGHDDYVYLLHEDELTGKYFYKCEKVTGGNLQCL